MKGTISHILQHHHISRSCEMYIVLVIHGGFQLMHMADLKGFLGLQEVTYRRTLGMC